MGSPLRRNRSTKQRTAVQTKAGEKAMSVNGVQLDSTEEGCVKAPIDDISG